MHSDARKRKRKKRYTTKEQPRASNRGRRSKAQEREILDAHGAELAVIFEREPLRQPVDPRFAHCYAQVLHGDAHAILRYCDDFWEKGGISGSFYELVGRLFAIKFYKIADTILRDIERRCVSGRPGWPSDRSVYHYWYGKLKQPCVAARAFLRRDIKADPSRTRDQRWNEYLGQRWPTVSAQQATKQLSDLGPLITFRVHKVVPKEVFFELASTSQLLGRRKFRFAPGAIARRYACRITDLCESTVSHWKT